MEPKTMRVALYGRVSTNNGRQDTENQFMQLREFAGTQGWKIVHEYKDHASGKRSDRKEFQAMLDAASRREYDALLFWSLDRFSREGTRPTLNYLQQLNDYGVIWRSFQERYLDTTGPMRDAVISILAAVAKYERERLVERVKAGLAKARKNGRIGGRPKAEDNAKLVQTVQRLSAAGKTIRQIAAEADISTNTVLKIKRTLEGEAA